MTYPVIHENHGCLIYTPYRIDLGYYLPPSKHKETYDLAS